MARIGALPKFQAHHGVDIRGCGIAHPQWLGAAKTLLSWPKATGGSMVAWVRMCTEDMRDPCYVVDSDVWPRVGASLPG